MRFFTSDLHLGHVNIIAYSQRPWGSVEAMNEGLIERWNETVGPDDEVWVLGDFAMGVRRENVPLVARLNGTKHLLAGNHDYCWPGTRDWALHDPEVESAGRKDWEDWVEIYLDAGFATVRTTGVKTDFVGDTLVWLSHFPYEGTDSRERKSNLDAFMNARLGLATYPRARPHPVADPNDRRRHADGQRRRGRLGLRPGGRGPPGRDPRRGLLMRIIVCGGRDFDDAALVYEHLDSLNLAATLLVAQGGAGGADAHARSWCSRNRAPCVTFRARWDLFGRGAGPIRNRQMLITVEPDLVLAFPGGRGTAHMVEIAEAADVPVRKIEAR